MVNQGSECGQDQLLMHHGEFLGVDKTGLDRSPCLGSRVIGIISPQHICLFDAHRSRRDQPSEDIGVPALDHDRVGAAAIERDG